MSNRSIAKVDKQEVATRGQARGFEFVDTKDISMPQIKVLQATSPEVKEGIAKMGDIIHTAANTTTSGEFIPLVIWQSRTFFAPRDNAKKFKLFEKLGIEDETGYMTILCKSRDGRTPEFSQCHRDTCISCPFSQWTNNKPPLCQMSINVLAYLTDLQIPGVIRFASTNMKYGRKFRDTSMWLGMDLFANKYQLQAKLVSNNKGEFYNTPVKLLGKTSEEEYAAAADMYNKFSKVVFNFTDNEAETDTEKVPF